MPMQQMLLGLGAAQKTYMEDLFSINLYRGTGSEQSINNGLKMSDGGLTWIKMRTQSNKNHQIFDTARGTGKYIAPNTDDAQATDNSKLSSVSFFQNIFFSSE